MDVVEKRPIIVITEDQIPVAQYWRTVLYCMYCWIASCYITHKSHDFTTVLCGVNNFEFH